MVKKAAKFSAHEFVIPQKRSLTAPIWTVGAEAGTRSLGVMFDLQNKGQHHVDYIDGKGNEWVSRVNSDSYISRQDTWCSYMYQLELWLAYSIEALSADPTEV